MKPESGVAQQGTTLVVLNRRHFARRTVLAASLVALGIYLAAFDNMLWQICGWLLVAISATALVWNGLLAWNPERFGYLRLDDRTFDYRIGMRKRTVDYLTIGRFHLVNYLGGDCLVWRTREREESLGPADMAMPPDPFDETARCIQLPHAALPPGRDLAEICASLNLLRTDAMKAAGVGEVEGAVALDAAAKPYARRSPFLAPPPIGRILFVLSFFASIPIYLIIALLTFRPIHETINGAIDWLDVADASGMNQPPLAGKIATYVILFIGYFLLLSWIVLGRLRDFDRNARWPTTFSRTFDLLLGGGFQQAREMTRLLGRGGRR